MLAIQGKWVLLTGSSRGVGKQVAGAFADKGCRLILHSRKLEHTAELAAQFQARGLTVHALAAELSDQDQVIALAREALRVSGGIDILYNNAGIQMPWHEDMFTTDPAEYELSFQVNTIAPITLCNLMLPGMIERKFGRVVNLTSGVKDQPQLMGLRRVQGRPRQVRLRHGSPPRGHRRDHEPARPGLATHRPRRDQRTRCGRVGAAGRARAGDARGRHQRKVVQRPGLPLGNREAAPRSVPNSPIGGATSGSSRWPFGSS